MAYQQQQQQPQYENYSQPRQQRYPQQQQQQQQQYYDQPPQQSGRQPGGYNDQYHEQYNDYDYGYDQGQGQWDDGYYDQQQGGWDHGQAQQPPPQRGGYSNANGQMRQGQPPRRPPPGDQYGQDMYDEQAYQQGRNPRGRPMGPPGGGPMQGGMQRGDSRGRGDGRPPNLQQGQPGLRPPRPEHAQRSPVSPQGFSQDNPFPVFPSQKGKQRPKAGSMDEAMSLMSIGQNDEPQGRQQRPPQGPPQGRGRGPVGPPDNRGPLPNRGPPPGRGEFYGGPDMNRHDSGHSEGDGRDQRFPPQQGFPQQRPPPMNMEGARRPPPQRFGGPPSPTQHEFGPVQRSMTMPQNMGGGGDPRGYDNRQQWQEPGPVAGYRGPDNANYVPPRPSTAGGTKHDGHGRQQHFEQRPPMPPMPAQQQQQQQYQQQQYSQPQEDHQGELDNVYDDYYGDNAPADRKSKASSIDMPDFDAIQDHGNRHRRGYSIENHLSPITSPSAAQPMNTTIEEVQNPQEQQQNSFYQQASRSRSQPDLHGQYQQANDVYEMSGDTPAVPPMPTGNPNRPAPNGLPGGPRGGRGPPPRGMTADPNMRRGPPDQGYGPGPQQNFGPRNQQRPIQRGYSDETTYSEPGPHAMRNGSPMVPGNQVVRPGTAGPAPGRMPNDPVQRRPGTTQPRSPDALPAHPTPVRAGLLQQNQDQSHSPQASRPPPMRQYNTNSTTGSNGPESRPSMSSSRRSSIPHPVTHDELNRLRATLRNNPSDTSTALQLAKKLVEASSVLANENGTADKRTRDKNKEKFVMEAYKMVKKLVQSGSPDAMFYLADCYGQGRLGLQVDTKEAFTLYQSAAKAGHPASAYRTAVCCEMGHEEGGGTKKDPLKAVQWYRRAAALGDVPAQYKMGIVLSKGLLGQQKNLGEAINMLKRAADRADAENPHALHELAQIYESTTGNERIIRDEAYAAQLFTQAAELGYKFSQFRLGQAYEYGLLGFPIDARASLAWYTKSAAQEEHQSELALSGWYLTGSQGILEQSDTEAYLWARKAACAEPPLPKALFAMGYFTEVGIGCPRSLEEAKRWYGRAATYKFPKAQERLEELKRGGAKVQRSRERLSRTNQQQQENCTVM